MSRLYKHVLEYNQNKNVLTAAFSLTFLEIRSRNEQTINSTQNRIHSPKITCMLITRPFAYNESSQHPTIAVLLIKIFIFFGPRSSVHLFQSNQHFQAIADYESRCLH